MLIHHFTQSFRMATTAFICDVGDSEESVRSLQLKQRGCSYTLLQVLVGVQAVLVLAMTGGIIWMKMSQNYPEGNSELQRDWMLRFTTRENYIETDFTSPRSEEYYIRGNIFIKRTSQNYCPNTFKLFQKLTNGTDVPIAHQNINKEVIKTVNLQKGSGLIIKLNCREMEFDEAESNLQVYQKTCY